MPRTFESLQALFDASVDVLAARGFTRAGLQLYFTEDDGDNRTSTVPTETDPTGDFYCRYRSAVGPCAVGAIMSDEDYDPKYDEENMTVTLLPDEALPVVPGVAVGAVVDLLGRMQRAHDRSIDPDDMRNSLRQVAQDSALQIPDALKRGLTCAVVK